MTRPIRRPAPGSRCFEALTDGSSMAVFGLVLVTIALADTVLQHTAYDVDSNADSASQLLGNTSADEEPAAPAVNSEQIQAMRELDALLNTSRYDKRIRPIPASGSGPTVITVDCYIRSISSVDEMKMDFSVDILIRSTWLDSRLSHDITGKQEFISGGPAEVEQVWKPDMFFANARHGYLHHLSQPNTMLRIFANGAVLYSVRYTLTLSCDMDLSLYPFDQQTCYIQIGSFGATNETQVYKWSEVHRLDDHRVKQPITINDELQLPKFRLDHNMTDICNNIHYTGNYSCLRLKLVFGRELGYHFTQSYIPNVLLVVASWITFFLDVDAVPARVTLGVTTLLTTTSQHKTIKDDLPPVSYTKAIDVWTGTCTFFVFCALVEFAIVNVLYRREQQLKVSATEVYKEPADAQQQQQHQLSSARPLLTDDEPADAAGSTANHHQLYMRPTGCRGDARPNSAFSRLVNTAANAEAAPPPTQTTPTTQSHKLSTNRMRLRAVDVDAIARFAFPTAFLVFITCYGWAYVRHFRELTDGF